MAGSRHDTSCRAAPAGGELPQLTRFARIGGAEAVARVVDAFYDRMHTLPQAAGIRGLHRPDLAATKDVLRRYLGEWLGGPALYSQERGHPQLRRRHIRFPIGPGERDAWMLCMRGALEDVVDDASLREDLLAAFFKLADWVRNDKDNPHDKHR
ncbi:MAG TPA: group II truncated hemoglobin [Acidisphaera sp.]|nr:group II truncated hemoglobin [Acidisphaera sp.]